MAEQGIAQQAGLLDNAVDFYLKAQSPWAKVLASSLNSMAGVHRLFLFGGLLRDLALFGANARPRDVDLVIDGVSTTQLIGALRPYIERTTKFGGLQLRVEGTEIDIWPLASTWAFSQQGIVSPCVENLPTTTFLDIEAIAVEISLSRLQPIKLFSQGFFEAIHNRTIEINLADNPYPEICVARSLDLASRIGFAIGPRLCMFVSDQFRRFSDRVFLSIFDKAHGASVCPKCLFRNWRATIAAAAPGAVVPPPVSTRYSVPTNCNRSTFLRRLKGFVRQGRIHTCSG